MEAVPEGRRGLASSVYNGVWQGAWALGALIGGSLITFVGYGSLFLVAAVCYATSILLLAWWFAAPDGQRAERRACASAAGRDRLMRMSSSAARHGWASTRLAHPSRARVHSRPYR